MRYAQHTALATEAARAEAAGYLASDVSARERAVQLMVHGASAALGALLGGVVFRRVVGGTGKPRSRRPTRQGDSDWD